MSEQSCTARHDPAPTQHCSNVRVTPTHYSPWSMLVHAIAPCKDPLHLLALCKFYCRSCVHHLTRALARPKGPAQGCRQRKVENCKGRYQYPPSQPVPVPALDTQPDHRYPKTLLKTDAILDAKLLACMLSCLQHSLSAGYSNSSRTRDARPLLTATDIIAEPKHEAKVHLHQ